MEAAYAMIRRVEQELDVGGLDATDGLRALPESTYDHRCDLGQSTVGIDRVLERYRAQCDPALAPEPLRTNT
ncbi:hypothetical protein [Cryobacterium glaciale]|uniref:hypothetical protein n=1 Tax=Cryobacterium glaciale TaxID=1259145 RepID=UPI001F541373|nr:hypothetical protein [Cryobacterium glaciale]